MNTASSPMLSMPKADSAAVTVTQTRDGLRVRIADDGRGGAQVRRDGQSTGLAGLTDRVRATGGMLEVTSPPGGGTVLQAELPLSTRTAPVRPQTAREGTEGAGRIRAADQEAL